MAEVIPFPQGPRKKKRKSEGKTLCKRGFHKWAIDQDKQFDVRQGKLVTIQRCVRCGYTRTTLS
ncbi:MAG: hypothetical protein RLW62_22190 [Gammaproteobacteria bacterium]